MTLPRWLSHYWQQAGYTLRMEGGPDSPHYAAYDEDMALVDWWLLADADKRRGPDGKWL